MKAKISTTTIKTAGHRNASTTSTWLTKSNLPADHCINPNLAQDRTKRPNSTRRACFRNQRASFHTDLRHRRIVPQDEALIVLVTAKVSAKGPQQDRLLNIQSNLRRQRRALFESAKIAKKSITKKAGWRRSQEDFQMGLNRRRPSMLHPTRESGCKIALAIKRSVARRVEARLQKHQAKSERSRHLSSQESSRCETLELTETMTSRITSAALLTKSAYMTKEAKKKLFFTESTKIHLASCSHQRNKKALTTDRFLKSLILYRKMPFLKMIQKWGAKLSLITRRWICSECWMIWPCQLILFGASTRQNKSMIDWGASPVPGTISRCR